MSRSYTHAGEYTTIYKYITIRGISQGEKFTNDIRSTCKYKIQVWKSDILVSRILCGHRRKEWEDNKRVYIVSILNTKDYKTIIKNICQDKNAIFFFTSGNNKKRYVSKHKLYKEAKNYLNDINMYKEEFEDAINISKKAYNDRTILIIGSFYVYKDAIKYLEDTIIND